MSVVTSSSLVEGTLDPVSLEPRRGGGQVGSPVGKPADFDLFADKASRHNANNWNTAWAYTFPEDDCRGSSSIGINVWNPNCLNNLGADRARSIAFPSIGDATTQVCLISSSEPGCPWQNYGRQFTLYTSNDAHFCIGLPYDFDPLSYRIIKVSAFTDGWSIIELLKGKLSPQQRSRVIFHHRRAASLFSWLFLPMSCVGHT